MLVCRVFFFHITCHFVFFRFFFGEGGGLKAILTSGPLDKLIGMTAHIISLPRRRNLLNPSPPQRIHVAVAYTHIIRRPTAVTRLPPPTLQYPKHTRNIYIYTDTLYTCIRTRSCGTYWSLKRKKY